MTESTPLERRYRRLLALYPRRFRRRREDEMVTTLMDGAAAGQHWPRAGETADLLAHSAGSYIAEGPPPGSFAQRHPREVIWIRLAVSVWLIIVSVWLTVRFSPWFLAMLAVVAIHLLLAARTAYGMHGGEPPAPSQGR